MKIGQFISQNNQIKTTDSPIELKEGDVLSSSIKERLPNNEAIIQVRGKVVQVKFDGPVPPSDKFTICVTGSNGNIPEVKAVTSEPNRESGDSVISKVLRSFGTSATPELKEVVKYMLDRGIPLSKESVADLKAFLEKYPGMMNQKLETIKAIANKGLEITTLYLSSVHEALHGKPLSQQLVEISKLVGFDLISRFGDKKNIHHVGENQLIDKLQKVENNSKNNIDHDINIRQSVQQENTSAELNDIYQLNEELLAGLRMDSKDIVVTHITNRMAQAAAQFRDLKRESVRNLDNLIKISESTKSNVYPQIKQVLQSTIDLIDKAILKSDFVMFADMATEKQLMSVSMDLANAKKLVANGQNEQASSLLKEIKTKLTDLNWRPADVKIKHVLTNEQVLRETNPPKQVLMHIVDQSLGAERSARNTFELIRSLGVNYESEVAQSLVLPKMEENQDHLQKNMKAALMKLLNANGDVSVDNRLDNGVKELIQNVTGQQLLSKQETGSPLQTMFFSLPIMMGADMESVKLYINSRKDGQKIDWENCSLYFLIDTKKLGETGILLTANNRNLSITIKNNHPTLKEKMETLVDRCKENLKEIGYNITALNFTKLSTEKEMPNQTKINEPPVSQLRTASKGLDFTI